MGPHSGGPGKMGLRTQLILFIVSIVAAAFLGWGSVLVRAEIRDLRAEAERHGVELLQTLAIPCAVALADREIETLDAILAQFSDGEAETLDILWIAVLNPDGEVVAHTDPAQYGRLLHDPFVDAAREETEPQSLHLTTRAGTVMRIAVPIRAGVRWGTLVADVSLARVDALIADRTRSVIAGTGGLAILLAALLSLFLSDLLVKPIEALGATARRISEGERQARVSVPGRRGELTLLARTFNEMADRIAGHTAALEHEVEKRTMELRRSNAALARANEELGNAVAQLERLASTDGLTQVRNHRSFQDALRFEIQRAKRNKSPLSLLMIDVDHFKLYNDTHGHPAGDQVLVQLSRILEENLRSIDVVARYGGEEFGVILADTSRNAARMVASKLREAVREYPFPNADRSQPNGRLTVSIGVATYPEDAITATALVAQADRALYTAKRLGRDQIFQEMAG